MQTREHNIFLKRICEAVDRITEEHLPTGLSPEDVRVNIRFSTGKHPLGDHIRVLGGSIFVRLETVKFASVSSVPGQRIPSSQKSDKFLGFDVVWIKFDHVTTVYPGDPIEIDGMRKPTCYISVMEENALRVQGTCEEFFDMIEQPLTDYLENDNGVSEETIDEEKISSSAPE